MKKIYQVWGKPNCMQVALASLIEMPVCKVPDFFEFKKFRKQWLVEMKKFLMKHGYELEKKVFNAKLMEGSDGKKHRDLFPIIKKREGVDGYFFASVLCEPRRIDGKMYGTHAVIIDRDFNIVHDPNPKYADIDKYPEAERIGYNGIAKIMVINKKMEV